MFGLRIGGPQQVKIITFIIKELKKPISELTENDLISYYPINDNTNQEIFYQDFSKIFKNYHFRYEDNRYNQWRTSQGETGFKFLNEIEFISKYGEAPWNLLNQIIKEAKLDYHITTPEGLHRDSSFEMTLINDKTGVNIPLPALSSGERILMSLALALYNSALDVQFPQVLLLDEPDASLHPSMSKQFLDIIENVFVKDKGVKVIMTTHSPSTVALAKEECLFVMNKTDPRFEKTTKDKALKTLIDGVPSLSISYENRRQVFVESNHDLYFYERLYGKLSSHLENEISLNFIPSGVTGAESCSVVQEMVNKLRRLGNTSIFGIIDWDTRNNGNEFLKVLGKGKRYSIENYIFDPILVAAFLLREKFISREELGLLASQNFLDFKHLSQIQLQSISDFIVSKLSTQIQIIDQSISTVEYINKIKINIPQWYLTYKGHDLEANFKLTFPQLNKYRNEGTLKREIIDKVIDDLPEFISVDILELFSDIQKQ